MLCYCMLCYRDNFNVLQPKGFKKGLKIVRTCDELP